ncbi:hypothetical protein HNV08_05870 [Winogradskyella eckloniae]|uniref:hypothetical protein n=1 Tax=Winogradskyella eckloniae TaxID=1089306 RepID=UPI00156654C4|nr:hypothetical protein [Winogradskyella eckloniae]NRD19566.1 hypothetical protein [Winogradskyella eckloniae]
MIINKIVKNATSNPRRLFLLDGFGAILSSFLLGVVLVEFEQIFGMPIPVLYGLAVLPLFFLVYDIYSYMQTGNNVGLLLKGIAVINILYCCLSLGITCYHIDSITVFGWLYVIIEIIIVLLIAIAELRVGNNIIASYK